MRRDRSLQTLDYGLMIVPSNSASVQCFLCDFQLSRYHATPVSAISASGVERAACRQTGEDYSNTTVIVSNLLSLASL